MSTTTLHSLSAQQRKHEAAPQSPALPQSPMPLLYRLSVAQPLASHKSRSAWTVEAHNRKGLSESPIQGLRWQGVDAPDDPEGMVRWLRTQHADPSQDVANGTYACTYYVANRSASHRWTLWNAWRSTIAGHAAVAYGMTRHGDCPRQQGGYDTLTCLLACTRGLSQAPAATGELLVLRATRLLQRQGPLPDV
jgi:hypothetical protein